MRINIFKKILLFIVILLLARFIYIKYEEHNVIIIHSFIEALPYLQNCDPNNLVIFDVDDTLIRGHDVGMANGRDLPLSFKILAVLKHPSIVIRSNWDYYYSFMWKRAKRFVIEDSIIKIIKDLKQRNCSVLALTLINSGKFGIIDNFSKFRYENLKDFGIEFSDKFPNAQFTQFKKFSNAYPALYKGIIFTNMQNKGSVLGGFLDHFKLKPNKVIFFDDHLDFLEDVSRECKRRKIQFIGFYYQAKKQWLGEFSLKRALLELDYLVEHKQWLTNQQSEMILNDK